MARFNLMARLPMARLLGGSCMRLSAGASGARTDPKEGTEMALKDVEIRALKPCEHVYKCTDGNGLYVEVHPNGSKLWRYKFSHLGKDKRIALGRYPDVGLAEARRKRDDARRKLQDGVDPVAEHKHDKLVAVYKAANTFSDVAKEYIDKMVAEGRADTTRCRGHPPERPARRRGHCNRAWRGRLCAPAMTTATS
jgi:hypothetical protein